MNNHLQKSTAPFRPFFGTFKENSPANFSGCTNFCRAPFEFCGRNFGPLATLQFNTGEQMLIFRLELDPQFASVFQHMLVPRNFFPPEPDLLPQNFREESNGETDKVDCFADDATGSTLMERNNLVNFKNILDNFGLISGLKCNFEKTFIMSTNPVVPDEIVTAIGELEFVLSNSIKFSGFEITREVINEEEYYANLLNKLTAIINFWQRFHLSLPGRINVFKTLLLSQIGYGGCFLNFSEDKVKEIQLVCNNFVLQKLKLSKEKLYSDAESGGVGLINIKDFLIALQATWVGRAHRSTRDCWEG
jgi:hypothetical protein